MGRHACRAGAGAQDAADRLPVMGQGAAHAGLQYFRRVRVYGERLRCLHRTGSRGPPAAVEGGPVKRRPIRSGAYCPPGASARRGRAGVPGALMRPWRCEQAAIRPSRLVQRPDRPARAGCPACRADAAPAPRGSICCPAAPAAPCPPGCACPLAGWLAARKTTISHAPSKTRTTTAMTSTAVIDMDEPGSVKRPPSFAARPRGAAHGPRPVPVTGAAADHAGLAVLLRVVARVLGRAAQRSDIPPQTCISS